MKYPSSITRAQFKIIRPLLERARKHTKPRTLDLYDVFNALLYVNKTCCQWRELPNDFPDFRSVHAYFRIWSEVPEGHTESILAQVLKKIGRERAYEKWQKLLHEHGYR
jgi:transposase